MTNDILDILLCQFLTGGRIGIWEHDTAVFSVIVLFSNRKIVRQGNLCIGNPQHICPDIIKGIGNVRKQNRFLAVKAGHKGHGQHIVRPHPHKYLLRRKSVICCNGIYQILTGGIRIQTKICCIQLLQGFFYLRWGRIRIFICIKFNYIAEFRLFAGYVRYDPANIVFPVFHLISSLWIPRILRADPHFSFHICWIFSLLLTENR